MSDAIDIFRAAKLVIDRHGGEAALYAAARTAVLAGEGDIEGLWNWVETLTWFAENYPQEEPVEE